MGGGIKQRHHLKAMIFTGLVFIVAISFIMWIKGQADRQPVPTATANNDARSAEWKKYGTDEYGDHFYRFDDSGRQFPDVMSVKTRLVYSEEGKKRYIDQRHQAHLPMQGFDKLSSRTVLYGINCLSTSKELCVLEVFELTEDGTTLDYAKTGSYKDWSHIPSGSVHEKLFHAVCPEKRQ